MARSAASPTVETLPRKPRRRIDHLGLAQLSLVEHALCPLDRNVSLKEGSQYRTGFFYGKAAERAFAHVTVTAAQGLSPNDEFFLWGLLALTLREDNSSFEFWATPYYCLRQLGYADSYASQGGSQYQLFADSVRRLSHVIYWSEAFYNPIRREHMERTMGFLKYERPIDPESSRQCRFVWDPLFLEFCRATGGGRLFFDLSIYRQLDFASRRLFLLLHKLFGGRSPRPSATYRVRHLAVNVLGFADQLPLKILKQKLTRVLGRMLDIGAIRLPAGARRPSGLITKRAKGRYSVALAPGTYFTSATPTRSTSQPNVMDSPLYDPLHSIGFGDQEIARILRKYPKAKVRIWADITLRAMEGVRGFPGFRKDPKAFFAYHIAKAADNKVTPPDWWHAAKKEEDLRRRDDERREFMGDDTEWLAAYQGAREAAFDEYVRDHQEDFDRLVSIFEKAHARSMYGHEAHRAAATDARRQLEGRFQFPTETQWFAERYQQKLCQSE